MPHVLKSSIAGLVVLGTTLMGSRSSVADLSASQPGAPTARVERGGVEPGVEQVGPHTRTVYVSVTDKKDNPVTDMQAADLDVKVGGKTQEVVSLQPAKAPLRIALLVADAGSGGFQLGVARFMQKLLGHAEFALISVVTQPEKIVDYSADAPTLSAGVGRLGTRGRQTGGQLMEAIQDATKEVRDEGKRPVIVAMRVGAENPTDLSGNDVREQLRKSGAILFVISALGAGRAAPSQARGTDAVSVQQGQLRDSELADSANNLNQVLGDGAKDSGGRHEEVVSTTMIPVLEQVAQELLNQYVMTYTVPDNVKAGEKVSVSSKRKNVTVRAPSRLSN